MEKWSSANANIDINYLVKVINKNKDCQLEEVPRFKVYDPLTAKVTFNHKVIFNQKYVYDSNCDGKQFKYKYFKGYEL